MSDQRVVDNPVYFLMGCVKMKIYLLLLLVILVSCMNVGATRISSPTIRGMEDVTVALVYVKGANEVKAYCSGVWVGSNVILTANHCIEGVLGYINSNKGDNKSLVALGLPISYVIYREAGEVSKAPSGVHLGTCVAVDTAHDLALIRAEGGVPAHGHALVAEQLPAIGERVSGIGHPLGLYWTYVSGIISSYRATMPADWQGPFIQVSIPIWYGNSGGGLFDNEGKLIGIASFITSSPNTAFYIHPGSIRKFLRDNKVL